MKPPPGVSAATVGPVRVWARPEALAWAERAIGEAGSLHTHASRRPAVFTLQGRGPVHVIPTPLEPASNEPAQWVVRRFYRGGGVRWLGDRYLRTRRPRPFAEWMASEFVRSRGIATPRVQVAAVHPSGLVYRGETVSEYIPDGAELAAILFGDREGERDPAVIESALVAAGRLVGELSGAGVHHPDLNARNILLRPTLGGWSAVVLDLDRCRIGSTHPSASAMRSRLARSIEKLGNSAGMAIPARALRALEASEEAS